MTNQNLKNSDKNISTAFSKTYAWASSFAIFVKYLNIFFRKDAHRVS